MSTLPVSVVSHLHPIPTPGISARSFASAFGTYAVNRYAPAVVGAVQSRMDNLMSKVTDKISGKSEPSSSGQSGKVDKPNSTKPSSTKSSSTKKSDNNKPPGNKKSGYRPSRSKDNSAEPTGDLTSKTVPQFTINTGIQSGTLINPMQPTTECFTPLYILCGEIFPDSDNQSESMFTDVLNTHLFGQYDLILKKEITSGMNKNFTSVSFNKYLKTISKALQIYYMIDSIIAYNSQNYGNNLAMTKLRLLVTPDITNGHIQLRECLERHPIPPKLLEYVKYMYQNYSFNDVLGSPVIRLSYKDILCTSEYGGKIGLDSTYYHNIINELFSMSSITSMLLKIKPHWSVELPASTYQALFDPQFSTFWHNANISFEDYGSKTIKYTQVCNSRFDPLYYGIFDNRLDGLIYASYSVFDGIKCNQPGIWVPFDEFEDRNSINSSLLHFSNDFLIRPVTECEFRFASMVHSAPYTRITESKNPVWEIVNIHSAASCIVQLHNIEMMTHATWNSVKWLFDPNL